MNAKYFDGDKKYKIALYVLLGLLAGIAFLILFGVVVQFLWNETIADMFSLSTIGFWQALGLFILAKLFFGIGGSGGSGGSNNWPKRRKRKRGRGRDTDGEVEADADFEDDAFKQYWQEEGKAAFEAFQNERKSGEQD